jgi:ribosomal protein S18 acetylase RimI-like enzyme
MSTGDIVIRSATAADIDILESIEVDCFPTTNPTVQRALPGEVAAAVLRGEVLVATINWEIVGFVHTSAKSPGHHFVDDIAVIESARGHGVGRHLVATALTKVGESCIVSCTIAPTNTSSLILFTQMGFVITALVPDYYGPGKDRLWLERPSRSL